MVIIVDIDDTICFVPGDKNSARDYSFGEPIRQNIEKINDLYDQGHTIIYWTARGSQTGIDWTETTKKQIKEWGAKCHEVRLGKPHYDLLICDKAINSNTFFGEENNG